MVKSPRIRPARRELFQSSLLAWLILAISPAASGADLARILQRTAVEAPAEVSFSEERHNPMFREPMVLTGHLEYRGDGVLRKVIESPFVEDMLIEDNHLYLSRDAKTRKLSLNRSRALKTILGAIEAVLAGDMQTLEASFEIGVSGTDDDWTLQMTPSSRSIARRIEAFEVKGDDQQVTSIRIELPDEEWHLMTIGHP